MWQETLKLVLISILIGILLGVFGATAAHYFRAGIHFIEQFVLFYFFVVSVLLHL
jgi:CIC family chloride channel protein